VPRVSIVVPVWNQECFLGECLESALAQTYLDRVLVFVDDGSTDRTPEILSGFGERIRASRQENGGFAAALNNGIARSTGEYVAWLSSDDLFLPTKIERQVEYLDAHPEVNLVYTDFYEIDAEGRTLREVRSPWFPVRCEFARRMLWNNFVNGSSVLMRRSAFKAVGGFPLSPRFQADGVLWFRMLAGGSAFGHVPELLTKYRIHAGQGSQDVGRLQRDMADYYRRALALFTIEDVFGDRADQPGWRAAAHRELGDILAYRQLTGMAVAQYLRSFALASSSGTAVALARAVARAARARLRSS
jgi:teichuronic acid biosynthesis glycosyltransferase TuaG